MRARAECKPRKHKIGKKTSSGQQCSRHEIQYVITKRPQLRDYSYADISYLLMLSFVSLFDLGLSVTLLFTFYPFIVNHPYRCDSSYLMQPRDDFLYYTFGKRQRWHNTAATNELLYSLLYFSFFCFSTFSFALFFIFSSLSSSLFSLSLPLSLYLSINLTLSHSQWARTRN